MKNEAALQEKIVKNILGYVPSMVIKYNIEEGREAMLNCPVEKEIETVVMFADISGFTMLSEKLASKGEEVRWSHLRVQSCSPKQSTATWSC